MLETSSKAGDSSIGFDGKNWYSNEQLTDFNEAWFQAWFQASMSEGFLETLLDLLKTKNFVGWKWH